MPRLRKTEIMEAILCNGKAAAAGAGAGSASSGKMCANCNKKPVRPGYDYCGRTCGRAAVRASRAVRTAGAGNASPLIQTCNPCRKCGSGWRHRGHEKSIYCGRTCARAAGAMS